MKFSVVTSVLNGAAFLPAALRSVAGQSYSDVEYLVIDAGSTDGSREIALEAAAADPRIQVFSRPGERLYDSLLWGLDQARGDTLSWLNADDLYTPWTFATLASFLERNPDCEWVSGLPGCWDGEGRLRFVRAEGWRPQWLIRQGWFHGGLLGFLQQESMFFSKSLYASLTEDERNSVTQCRYAGDYVLWKAFAKRARLETLPSVLGGFRRHGANQSVVNLEAYMAEVKAAGAAFPPAPVRYAARRLYRGVSAWRAAARAIEEDRQF